MNVAASTAARSTDDVRARIRRQALSLGIAVFPFGVAFGVTCLQAGLAWWQAAAFSALVFTGSAQFAAVGVLASGGTAAAAILAGTLLNIRCLAFGILLAPALQGSRLWRAIASQGMIDESTAVAVSQENLENRRYAYVAGALAVFVLWNAATLIGFWMIGSSEGLVTDLGLDATIPAAFLALLWPRLSDGPQRRTAIAGAIIAAALIPVAPPGVPIIVAALGVVVAWIPPLRSTAT